MEDNKTSILPKGFEVSDKSTSKADKDNESQKNSILDSFAFLLVVFFFLVILTAVLFESLSASNEDINDARQAYKELPLLYKGAKRLESENANHQTSKGVILGFFDKLDTHMIESCNPKNMVISKDMRKRDVNHIVECKERLSLYLDRTLKEKWLNQEKSIYLDNLRNIK